MHDHICLPNQSDPGSPSGGHKEDRMWIHPDGATGGGGHSFKKAVADAANVALFFLLCFRKDNNYA